MGKGKREFPRSSWERGKKRPLRALLEDPFQDGGTTPFAPGRKKKPPLSQSLHLFWDSGKGKILLAAVCCAAILAGAVTVALRMWIKPPALPSGSGGSQPSTPISTPEGGQEAPAGPTDDELYPDDGYGGDMPTVSGNRKEGIYTFLLVGTDLDDGNTDTIMVVSYDTVNQDVNIMSIPRDTMINESWDLKKINSVYSRYSDGMGALQKRIKTLIGFAPDFYVKVDLGMFVELVDLIGGVEFDVPQDMDYDDDYQNLHIHLKKGLQTLDGESAMELVRFRRYSEGDIKRVEVQQAFMKALIQECLSLKHWGKVKAYIDLAMENVQTDLEFGSVVWFAANVLGLNGAPALSMDDVYTCTLPGDYWGGAWSRSTGQEQSYVTIYPGQVVELVNARFNPYEQRVTTAMLDAMSILDNGDIASSTGNLRDSTHNEIMALRRGEAYYDADGRLVYGLPPEKNWPRQDGEGRFYILDEEGNPVYTDESGSPLEQEEPELPTEPGGTNSDSTPSPPPIRPNPGGDGSGPAESDPGQPEDADSPAQPEGHDDPDPADQVPTEPGDETQDEDGTPSGDGDKTPDETGEGQEPPPDSGTNPTVDPEEDSGGDENKDPPQEPVEPDEDIPDWLLP